MNKLNIITLNSFVLILLIGLIQIQFSNAQAFFNASQLDLSSSCNSIGITVTNNDYVEEQVSSMKRSVIVYDGSRPGLYWDDGMGHKGHTLLGALIPNCKVVNPDVSLSSDGKWAIAVYQNVNNGYITAEVFQWISNMFSSSYDIKIYFGGVNAKIDLCRNGGPSNDEWMMVWNKDDNLAVFTTAGYMNSFVPFFDPTHNVMLQGNGTSIYSAPDVSILIDSVYYTYNEFDGTNNYLVVESQPWSTIKSGSKITPTIYDLKYSNSDYSYEYPRISSFDSVYYGYYDWAVVAQTLNDSSGGTEIHGFVKHWGNPVNSAPFVYNNGSLALGTPNDITRFQNDYPVVSYVGDYIFILWHVDPSGYSVTIPDRQDIIGVRMMMDGYSFSYQSEYYFIVSKSTGGNQLAPSISGRFAENKYLAAFYNDNTGAPNGKDVYYKSKLYNTPFNSLFRLGSVNQNSEFTVSPNPFINEINIELPDGENSTNTITITDAQGQQLFKCANIKQSTYIWKPEKELAPGLYYINITNQSGKSITQKITRL